MRQRTTNPRTIVARAIEADHRATLGQAVALIGWDTERPRTQQQGRIDACAADRDKDQVGRRTLAADA